MIKEVKKVQRGKYILNDAVVVYNIDFNDFGITYSVDWDENILEEAEAMAVAEAFFSEAVKNS